MYFIIIISFNLEVAHFSTALVSYEYQMADCDKLNVKELTTEDYIAQSSKHVYYVLYHECEVANN